MTSIRDIHSQFIHHRETAEGSYLGKILTVEAYVLTTGESMYSTPIVEASDAPDGETLAIFVLPFGEEVRASFARLKTVQPGQLVRVSGECRMFSDDGDVLVFKDCRLLSP
ncbi:MAG TPA: hypothetical protein VLL08_12000 [Kineosporiaceae bacterium]|nr:hypothetical protein [Kineosporiaceae bacterium]